MRLGGVNEAGGGPGSTTTSSEHVPPLPARRKRKTPNLYSTTTTTTTKCSLTRSLDHVAGATVVPGGHLRLEMLLQVMRMIVRIGMGTGMEIGRQSTNDLSPSLFSRLPRLIQIMKLLFPFPNRRPPAYSVVNQCIITTPHLHLSLLHPGGRDLRVCS